MINLDDTKFKAIILTNTASKYYEAICEYFKTINKEILLGILDECANDENFPCLMRAALLSCSWDIEEIDFLLKKADYNDSLLRALIEKKELTGEEIEKLIRLRISIQGSADIGQVIMAAINSDKLSGPQLVTLFTDPELKLKSHKEKAFEKIVKYIESE